MSEQNLQSENTYRLPPPEILQLADAQPVPGVVMDIYHDKLIFIYRNSYKTLNDLMQPEVRLAGRRVNPVTRISTSIDYICNLKIGSVDSRETVQVRGLPDNPRIAYLKSSPDERYISFINVTTEGLELWLVNLQEATAKKLTEARLNAFLGDPMVWLSDNKRMIVRFLPDNPQPLIDSKTEKPSGPVVMDSNGESTHNRTYQDLLKNETDAKNFEILANSVLNIVDIEGNISRFANEDMYRYISPSPDGNYLMLNVLRKPFSYLVPESRFAACSYVCKISGEFVKIIDEADVDEIRPKGMMAVRKGKREIGWRSDVPATVSFVTALDEGNPANEVEYRDALYIWEAPFENDPKLIFNVPLRFSAVFWSDNDLAIVGDFWFDNRRTCTYLFHPAQPDLPPKKIFDRNYQDIYAHPGNFELIKNKYGRFVLTKHENHLFLVGEGYSENEKKPFIDKLNLDNLITERIYQSELTDKLEEIVFFEQFEAGNALVRIQSADEYPNFYLRNIFNNTLRQITFFENPYESIKNVSKRILKYKRNDGVDLNGTLYLPAGFNVETDGKLPLLIWAYPEEFKDKDSAGQSTANPNEFIYPYYGSFIYWVTRGYAILDDASFPIIGEGNHQPNDTFIHQLIDNAQAAIDAVAETGFVDTQRVGIGGHSYGAFMVANLLTHTNLFKCGIARSGAYNRTLTPFGFQGEDRNFWDVPQLYDEVSPFRYAEKMKTPLLLIHGEADDNLGTFTLQTERYFQALKGLGAPVRMVILPKEKHRYVARENIMHMLWEQESFFEKHLK